MINYDLIYEVIGEIIDWMDYHRKSIIIVLFIVCFSFICIGVLYLCICRNTSADIQQAPLVNIPIPTFVYNSMKQTDLKDMAWVNEYDKEGYISKTIAPGKNITTYHREMDKDRIFLKRLIREHNDGSKAVWDFNEDGLVKVMSDSMGLVSYEYDDSRRIELIQRNGAPCVAYEYDIQNRIRYLRVGDFYEINYVYDFLDRLEIIKTPIGEIKYEYLTGQGLLIRKLPNNIKTVWKYEPNGLLRQITHVSAQNIILVEYIYEYRADGLIEAIHERSVHGEHVQSFEYDTVGRLIRMTDSSGKKYEYEYDQLGNRLKVTVNGKITQSCSYDWFGRLTTLDGDTCEYDAAGNLTSVTVNETSLKYSYNQDNQLAEVFGGKAIYQYDGNGQLITRKTGDSEYEYIPNPLSDYWQPLVIKEKDKIKTLIVWEGTTPLIMIRDGKPEYLLQDHLGSVRLMADKNGRILQQFNYEPFGNILAPPESEEFAPRFAGLFWDPQAKAYLTMARAYNTAIGRWLQVEPLISVPDGVQKELPLYAYCSNDPVNFKDKNGAGREKFDREWIWWSTFLESLFTFGGTREKIDYWNNAHFRDDIVKETIELTLKVTSNDIVDAAGLAQVWRKSPEIYAQRFPDAHIPTSQEWQAIDDFLFAWSTHTAARQGLDITRPGYSLDILSERTTASIIHYGGIIGWLGAHQIGELIPGAMQRVSRKSFNWMLLGDLYGHKNIDPQSIHFPPPEVLHGYSISPLQEFKHRIDGVIRAIDDLICPPAYGDEILPTGHLGYNGFDVQSGILMSTTGPGKRGGRGGGITRPPSWPRPPGPQGRPPLGPQPPPGGKPPRGTPGLGSGNSSLSPSNVGGVYLSGAGNSLDGLGLLAGIRLDSNNNLVLVSQDNEEINLPPLRLDDVVTVFRSVYIYGEGPTVTIDPNSENPEVLPMIILHSKATEDTYVGWVLYQADRLMKGYTLGKDNLTKEPVNSIVDGYSKVLDTIYFGGKDPEKMFAGGHWERFWIVPAESRCFVTSRRELSLFDVPLKVKTQSMKWEKGELVDDPEGKSSPGATAFTEWFTTHYNHITEEQFLTPPKESGVDTPVPVFTELRRIALITAIAENLRNQGIPMPFWMRDYHVQSVPFEKYTPSLKETRSNQKVNASVFGGVQLSAADRDVKLITIGTNIAGLEKSDQDVVREKLALVDSLEKALRREDDPINPLEPRKISCEGKRYTTVALPGAQTQALMPCRVQKADLTVLVDGGYSIQLVRSYNSFFDPSGELGKGWALDLPKLQEIRVPVERDKKEVKYQPVYELITPLNSMYARFSRIEKVPAFGDQCTLLVPDKDGEFFGLTDDQPKFLTAPTRKLLRKDGSVWHFTRAGGLVATEQNGFLTVYERDKNGRITRIVGMLGGKAVAFISLQYDSANRIILAEGKNAKTNEVIRYEYNDGDRLAGVESESGRLGYRYEGSLMTAETLQPTTSETVKKSEITLGQYQYNPSGQLLSKTDHNNVKTVFCVTSTATDNTLTVTQPQDGTSKTTSIRYDTSYRPAKADYADGTKISWSYPDNGNSIMEITDADGKTGTITESPKDHLRTLELDTGYKVVQKYDKEGRLISLSENGTEVLTQKWYPHGRLDNVSDGTCTTHYEYDSDNLTSCVLFAPPNEQGEFKHWQKIKLDAAGRHIEISDYRKMHILADYDEAGELTSVVRQQDGKNYGFQIQKNSSGQPEEIQSSWGTQHFAYDDAGLVTKWEIEKGPTTASVEWESGLVQKLTQFDGGEYYISYYDKGEQNNLLKEVITPDHLAVGYQYNESNQLSQVTVGQTYNLTLNYDNKGRLIEWRYVPTEK